MKARTEVRENVAQGQRRENGAYSGRPDHRNNNYNRNYADRAENRGEYEQRDGGERNRGERSYAPRNRNFQDGEQTPRTPRKLTLTEMIKRVQRELESKKKYIFRDFEAKKAQRKKRNNSRNFIMARRKEARERQILGESAFVEYISLDDKNRDRY